MSKLLRLLNAAGWLLTLSSLLWILHGATDLALAEKRRRGEVLGLLDLQRRFQQLAREEKKLRFSASRLQLEQVEILTQNELLTAQRADHEEKILKFSEEIAKRLGKELHLLVDLMYNELYIRKGGVTLYKAQCSPGKGGILTHPSTGRRWEFTTPQGVFRVRQKEKDPIWWKPDWAFIEEDKPVPPPNSAERKGIGELGKYALDLGDGYKIHGTKYEYLIGRPVSHGCIRMKAADLEKVYESAPVGTPVFVVKPPTVDRASGAP